MSPDMIRGDALRLMRFKHLDTQSLLCMVKDFRIDAPMKDWHRLPTGAPPFASDQSVALAFSEGWIDDKGQITAAGTQIVKDTFYKPADHIEANWLPLRERHQPRRNPGEMNYLHQGFDNESYF